MPEWSERQRTRFVRITRTLGRFGPANVSQDIRYAARTLRKQPGFAAAVIFTLALGVGGTTAIFSVVNGVLIKPLPYPDSDALVRIVHSIGGIEQSYFSDPIYRNYVDNTKAFQDLGVWSPGETAAITGLGEPEEVRTLTASRGVLSTRAPGDRALVLGSGGYARVTGHGDPHERLLASAIRRRPQRAGARTDDQRSSSPRLIASLLFGTTPLDPIAFAAMSLVLAAAAVLASYLAIRRALTVDPAEILRSE